MLEQINNILFWIGIFWLAVYGYVVFFNRGIPNIQTCPRIRWKMIELIRADLAVREKSDYTIVDIGSGDGNLSRNIARALPDAKVIGIEISAHLVAQAEHQKDKINLQNLSYRPIDFLNFDFSSADAIVMYLVPAAMNALAPKLLAETKTGTLILSNKFPLSGWQPVEMLKLPSIYLHQRDLYVYRKAG